MGAFLAHQYGYREDGKFTKPLTTHSLFSTWWPKCIEIYGKIYHYTINWIYFLYLIERSMHELKGAIYISQYLPSVEENVATSVCENVRRILINLFGSLEHRRITPKELVEVKKGTDNDYTSLIPIIRSYLSVGYFREEKITPELLLEELKAYDYFVWRNIRLRHIAHIFKDVSKGLLIRFHNK